jgi:3-oxoacid CoA-transferase subunit A
MNIFICGDLHGDKNTVRNFYNNHIKNTPKEQEENWMICLGDFGALYSFDYRDRNFKREMSKYPFKYFVIRGNHEARASVRQVAEPDLWEEVEVFGNKCLRQPAYPNIYYARDDGGIYNINGRKTLVIPGAYSVDKHYRLMRGWAWFPDEQLAGHERLALLLDAENQHFDFVFSHTCPYRYMPTDLFLGCVDQNTVDNTMEYWMDTLHDSIEFNHWCWGHFHDDRIEAPYCEMFFRDVESIEDVEARWARYHETGELDWWLSKSPNFYMFENKSSED